MLGIHGVGVGECQSEDPFVLAWNPHKGLACGISHETRRRRGKEGLRAEQKNQEKEAEQRSEENSAVGKREQELEPVDSMAGLTNVRGWVSILGDFVEISLEYTLALAHRCTECSESVTNFPLLVLGANPSQCLLVLFSSTLSVVYVVFCVSVKKCEIPLAGDEKNH